MNATMRRDHVYLVSRRDKKKILPSYAGCPFSEAGNSKYYTLNLRARGVQRGSFWRLNNERKGGLSSHCLRSDESLKHWRWEHLGDGRRRRRSSCWSGEKVTLIRFPFQERKKKKRRHHQEPWDTCRHFLSFFYFIFPSSFPLSFLSFVLYIIIYFLWARERVLPARGGA